MALTHSHVLKKTVNYRQSNRRIW